jgi:Carboxypeptidase regulatory-like domain
LCWLLVHHLYFASPAYQQRRKVELIGTDSVTTTTSKGNFTFKGLKPGIFAVKITKEGFEDTVSKDIEVKLGSNKTTEIIIKVKG